MPDALRSTKSSIKCRYEVLVIDLDGTLLRRDGTVSPANRNAVAEARAAGLEVIIATGRALLESREAIRAIEHDGLVVAAGGSLLCEASTGRTIDRRVLSQDVVNEASTRMLEHGHKVLILKDAHATGYDYIALGDGELDPASKWWFARLGVEVRHIDHIDNDQHPFDSVRAGVVACGSQLGPLACRLRDEIGDRCFLQHWSAVTASHAIGSTTHLLEIFTANVNKWTMIEGYCQQRGIKPAAVVAIGDGLNDVDLVEKAGLGVAMANSCAEVFGVAKKTTADHEEDGVAIAIDHILCGRW